LFHQLLAVADTPENVFAMAKSQPGELNVAEDMLRQLQKPEFDQIEPALEWASAEQNHIITLRHDTYPHLLKEIHDAPPVLYVHGNCTLLNDHQLAMVGSRNPTAGGMETATRFAEHLSQCGLTVTSGLALGIDTAAHRGALLANAGTIAVMGTGINRIYPSRNHKLAHEIIDKGGALITELPLDTSPAKENFPRRNRIISGMSLGTLVVEAAKRSGSLITARLATEQGREVFAIPGSIHNPLSRGCHSLIRQGAKLVETADDIIEELGQLAAVSSAPEQQNISEFDPSTLDNDYQTVLTCVGFEPTAIDTVVTRSGLTADAVSSMLLVLELQGYVQTHTGGFYSRKN
jgi:DNA processing protein